MEFFHNNDPRCDDIQAHHYTLETCRTVPAWYKDFKKKCDELLAHLTYDRAKRRDEDKHHWPEIPEKAEAIEGEIQCFPHSLPPQKKAWFDPQ